MVIRAWWVDKMWERDPQVTPKRFDEQAYSQGAGRPLRIAYFTTDEWCGADGGRIMTDWG